MPSPSFPDLRWGFRSAYVWTDKRNVIGGYRMSLAQGIDAGICGSSQSISNMPRWISRHFRSDSCLGSANLFPSIATQQSLYRIPRQPPGLQSLYYAY
ncbi:hypothetical protein PTI98_011968 [Pleurotus ostreatus]|nr:hypothetical protein PTI98_011968 [Pleurotus ostreatus]